MRVAGPTPAVATVRSTAGVGRVARMFYFTIIYYPTISLCCVTVCCIPGSGDRSERCRVYFTHLRSIIKHGVALPSPAVITVRSAAGFERATPMEVVKAQVCDGDGHPTLPSGMLEPCAEPLHTIRTN